MYSIIFNLCLALFFSLNFVYIYASPTQQVQPPALRKKVVIFMLHGGYGHLAASKALNQLLCDEYEVKVIDIFKTLKVITFKDGEENIYDRALKGGWVRSINFVTRNLAPKYHRLYQRHDTSVVMNVLQEEKPDLVISVASHKVAPVVHATNALKIPMLLATTDGDLSNWTFGINKKEISDTMKVAIGIESAKSRGLMLKAGVKNENIILSGFPIRKDFFEPKDKQALRAAWNIPADKFTVMLLMGGVGTVATYQYAKKLCAMKLPIHMVVCTGNNTHMFEKIKNLQEKTNASMTIVPFTQRVSDLMAASDVLITKAGPGSINEAMFMDLPMLIDKTSPILYWEEENVRFVEKNGFGLAVTSFVFLEKALMRLLYDNAFYQTFKNKLMSYAKPNFDQSIKQVVHQLCPCVPALSLNAPVAT